MDLIDNIISYKLGEKAVADKSHHGSEVLVQPSQTQYRFGGE